MSFTRYTGYTSPPYPVQFTDDTGAPINLTGVNPATGFTIIMQDTHTLQFQHGVGTWTITDAVNGRASYQWNAGDLANPGTFLIYVTVQLPGEPSPRAFDPDTVVVILLETGGVAVSGTDVNLVEVNGQPVSSANPVPTSGPVTMADGANVTQGSKGDSAIIDPTVSASEIALLKGLVKILALQSVAITGADGAIASLGSIGDAAWSGSGNGTVIALLKKVEALLAATQTIAGNVTEANSATINTHLANIDTDALNIATNTSNTATNTSNINTHAANIDTATAASKTDLDSIVTNTGRIPASPATEGGHLATIDSVQGTAGDANTVNSVMGRLTKLRDLLSAFVDGSVTGTVTNDNDAVAITCPGGQATAYVKITGTFVGTLLFEGTPDGGTTWDAMNAVAVGGSTVATQTTTTGAWRVNVSGLTSFRVKLHPTTSGTANIRINLSQGVHNVAVTNATKLGQDVMTNSAPVVPASDYIAPVKSSFNEQAALSAGSLNADLVASTDVSAYKWLSLHINPNAYSGTLTFQASNDNTNWVSMLLYRPDTDAASSATASTSSTNVIFAGPVTFRYFRVRMTAYTSGTAQGTLELYTISPSYAFITMLCNQSGAWTVQPGNTANTTPWLVSGSNNNAVQAANTAGNVVVKGTPGLLVGAMVTATGTIGLTVYDNASTNSGTPVLVIPANPTVGQLYPVNGWCKNGIVSAGVANCPGVTFFFA